MARMEVERAQGWNTEAVRLVGECPGISYRSTFRS